MENEESLPRADSTNQSITIRKLVARDYDQFAKARQVCLDLPALPSDGRSIPSTFQDALAAVARREEEKRRNTSSKESKSKKLLADKLAMPGAQPGMDSEASAFWMVMEVWKLSA